MKPVVLILMLIICQKIFSQDYYLLAGTYTKAGKSEGIYVYKFNSKTGEAKFVSSTRSDDPSYLTINDKDFVYAVNEQGDGKGTVSSFSFDRAKGSLQFLNKQLTNGDDPCYISMDASSKWVAVANYSGGSFSVFPVQSNGMLGAAAQTIQHTGTGPNKGRQEKAHVHSTVFSFDRHYLAVADLGMDRIMVYPFDASKEKPVTEKPIEIKTAPGSGPRHIIFSPAKPLAYTIEELSGNVVVYKYSDGKFEALQTINSHPEGFKGEKGSAAIHFSPDGKFLYASNRGQSNTLSIFSIDGSSGKLTSLGFQDTGGDHPRDFAIDPSGSFLLVGNTNSGNINILTRDRKTGLLKDSGHKIIIPAPTQLLFTHIR